MRTVLKQIFHYGSLIFAIGFLAPLLSQILVALDMVPPFGLSPLACGLIIALPYGLIAQYRGRWI